MAPDDWIRGEIDRLRNWRHDEVEPALRACAELPKAIESALGSQAALERRLTKVEETVQQMAEADKIGKAVAAAMQRQHGGILTKRQRWVGYGVALTAVVGVGIQVAHLFT